MSTLTLEEPAEDHEAPEPPSSEAIEPKLPSAPNLETMWTRLLIAVSIVVGLFLLDRFSGLLLNYWLLESMGFEDVFWTNFQMKTTLFAIGFVVFAAVVALPARLHGLDRHWQKVALWIGILGGLLMGYTMSGHYLEFLGPFVDVEFGVTDPVFNNDISFYIFTLPPLRIAIQMALLTAAVGFVASAWTAHAANRDIERPAGMSGLAAFLGRIGTPFTQATFAITGVLVAALIWLRRYDLLTADNFGESTEFGGGGADVVDITGFFSTRNSIYVEALAILALTFGVTWKMRVARQALHEPEGFDFKKAFGAVAIAAVLLPGISADLAFRAAVEIREEVAIKPDEPLIQQPYIQRHLDATYTAYDMDDIEEINFSPNGPDDPLPDLDTLLNSPTIKNAPLWPGFISRYTRLVAPHYVDRILEAEGDMTIYAPTLRTLEAQQGLRPYYGFMDIDQFVTDIDGEMTLLSSAAREIPQDVLRPWLNAWGQRSFVLTHGHGLVTMSASERTEAGDPVYATFGVPTEERFEELAIDEPSIYYGEGGNYPAFSNANGILEHDVSTDQGRAEVEFPEDVDAGIKVDSFLKRVVIGYQTGQLRNMLFSDLIDSDTRVHLYRRPIERLEQIAPFLLVDTDAYAVPAQGGVTWMLNGLTWSNDYPYSARAFFGDPMDLRTEWRPIEEVNYLRDSVKITMDAFTGQMSLYQFMDEPVIQTWAEVYPDLFQPIENMPEDVRAHVQYPVQLMYSQFDQIYPFYHQRDWLTFYAGEDLLDDADEVLGPIRGESGTITFSQARYAWVADTSEGVLPQAEDPVQFALSMSYTPQDPLNLRAFATVYQTGDDYGTMSVLKIPKGEFFLGPEQADSSIDQDDFIAQQIGLWNRLGVEVIRGKTSLLVVDEEVIYVEPIFIRSRQNPVPQLQRVIVVFRGEPHMGRTVEEALTFAIEGGQLPLFGDE